jgi:hypothetical protein
MGFDIAVAVTQCVGLKGMAVGDAGGAQLGLGVGGNTGGVAREDLSVSGAGDSGSGVAGWKKRVGW